MPEYGFIEVSLKRGDEESQLFTAVTARLAKGSKARIWSNHRCDFGEIESGEYRVLVRAEATGADLSNQDPRLRKTLISGLSADVVVKSGERMVVELP